mmetsp:Transcript_25360/g.58973  ORF Transcript_25360/g.58973 Transcript_25360/m.58973 type:complete len:185 (-) Transcript_25360:81-635(-)
MKYHHNAAVTVCSGTIFWPVVLLQAPAVYAEEESCTRFRPGGGVRYDRRMLSIPASTLAGPWSECDLLARERLCCVYTHVQLEDGDSLSQPQLLTYDGGVRRYSPTATFVEIEQDVMSDVCGMSMGSVDCRTQQSCIENATRSSSCDSAVAATTTTTPVAKDRAGRVGTATVTLAVLLLLSLIA